MKRKPRTQILVRKAFTLVEVLVVMGIAAILLAVMVKVAGSVFTNTKIKNTKSTIKVLVNALEQYKEEGQASLGNRFQFPNPNPYDIPHANYAFLRIPEALNQHYYDSPGGPFAYGAEADHFKPNWKDGSKLSHEQQQEVIYARATMEVVLLILDRTPGCKTVLNKLPGTALVNADRDYILDHTKPNNEQQQSLLEAVDAWETPLRYDYVPNNFPILRSAGPDGVFDNADDIISNEL